MSSDWKEELEKVKKETEEEVAEERKKEEELRKKYEGDKEKILDLIHSQLVPVVETFKKEGMAEMDQPKIQKHQLAIYLYLPIAEEGRHIGLTLSFGFTFSDEGYGVKTKREIYDHTRDRVFYIEGYIKAPVTAEGIQNKIREFIRDRSFAIKMLEEKAKSLERKWG